MAFDLPSPEELRLWRQRLNMTQADLAKRAGVSQPLIARIEGGTVDPRYSTLRSVVRSLAEAEKSTAKLKDLMTSPVITVRAGDLVGRAIELMRKHSFSQLPVLNKGVPVGSVSERVIVHQLAVTGSVQDLARRRVEEVMGPVLPMVDPDTSVDTVYRMVEEHPAVLVMERGRLVGLVSKSDVLELV
ncbi:MAG: CBS domain-containing protein [Methanobacteriota archaeon]